MTLRAIFSRFCPDRCRVALLLTLSFLPNTIVNAQPLDFTLADLDKQTVYLSDFRGRWAVVNFWATRCAPCIMEMPELQAFYEENQWRAIVIGVNFEESTSDHVGLFVKQLAITFPIALSQGKPVPGFEVKGLPTTFLISPDGELVDTHLGTVNADMLNKRLAELAK